jgi:dolichol-phosphate mannosyltransferase
MSPAAERAKLVSIVFSFRNEASVLPELIARLDKALAAQPERFEYIFVDDASTDGSLEVLTKARESNPRIKIVTMSRRFGVSECVLAGFEHAAGDAVIYMDTDLQDPPETIPAMLHPWREGADVVHTVRRRRKGENPLKLLLTRLAYRVIRWGATIPMTVDAGDFKLLSRRVVDELRKHTEQDPYLRGLIPWIGFTQVFVPYDREPRAAGRTHFPLFSRNPWKTLIAGLTSFSFTPIYAIGAVAIAGLVIAALLGIGAGVAAALRPAWTAALGFTAIALFAWSTILGAIAVVGVYVARTYKEARGRPLYVVDRRIGFDDVPERVAAERRTGEPQAP